MNLVFAGTPEFAVHALSALLDAGHAVRAVYTQPDRPAGRGRKLGVSAVKQAALARGLEIRQPLTLKSEEEVQALKSLKPDALIVIAYGLILPAGILAIPRFGCINVHASLLPRWRGAAPIQRAIEAGDEMTGVTIMQMDAGLDTGAMLALAATPIRAQDTSATLHDRLAEIGAPLLVSTLARLERGDITPQAQENADATYARKLSKDEARIDWRAEAALIARRIRAFNPWPVAHTTIDGQVLRLWNATEVSKGAATQAPGTILGSDTQAILVQCGHGVIGLTQLQAEGGKVLNATAFFNGRQLPPGTRLGT